MATTELADLVRLRDGHGGALRSLPRILVYAETTESAHQWLRHEGISLHARTTHVIAGPNGGRGFCLRPQDRVVFVGDVFLRRDYEQVLTALAPTLVDVGGLDKIEHREVGW
jgi:hypothetical protein